MRVPVATYRVQFNRDFGFDDATAIVPHLHRLGITHLYASPIWAAREGSSHGYDVVDPNRLNAALGTRDDFERLVYALRLKDMGLIVDIVPNHMAMSPENVWWMDVLENGAKSAYAEYFGIDWGAVHQSHGDKIFLPILGAPYGTALEKGEIQLVYSDARLFVCYYSHRLPVSPATYEHVGEDIEQSIRRINGTPGDPRSFDILDEILQQQAYRLAYWRVATERINYRRFFDVTDLIGVRVENPKVFRACHSLILDLATNGLVDGLRVDHIDGLADPRAYIERLPVNNTYIVTEKILVGDERLPPDWKLHGTTGYDFLGYMNSLFVDPVGLEQIDKFYSTHTGISADRDEIEYQRKLLIIDTLFAGEMDDLSANLEKLAEQDRYVRDLSPRELSRGLKEVTASMPVYRTYTASYVVSDRDESYLNHACREARRRCPQVDPLTYDFIHRVLRLNFSLGTREESKTHWLHFVRRWQQLTGSIMAKAVEDSAFYVHNRLVSLNEVGAIPRAVSSVEMHSFLAERRQLWPDTMNASSTHDTKRSEDVRARINVLSEMPAEWSRAVKRWSRAMRHHRGSVDSNEEYFYYQNLLGAWPLFPDQVNSFRERMKAYSTKAAREARVYTSWLTPCLEHERDLHSFIDAFFENEHLLPSFAALQRQTAFFGAVNALSQVLLKIAAPGLPDFYRGTIEWDFSLVDPDNRRPVTFAPLTDFDEPARSTLSHWRDGRVKIFLTEKALAFRKANPDLFRQGEYIPLAAKGKRADNLFAFARRAGDVWAIVVVPRLVSKLATVLRFPTGITAWRDTELMLPENSPRRWRNVLTGAPVSIGNSGLAMYRVLEQFPVALLVSK